MTTPRGRALCWLRQNRPFVVSGNRCVADVLARLLSLAARVDVNAPSWRCRNAQTFPQRHRVLCCTLSWAVLQSIALDTSYNGHQCARTLGPSKSVTECSLTVSRYFERDGPWPCRTRRPQSERASREAASLQLRYSKQLLTTILIKISTMCHESMWRMHIWAFLFCVIIGAKSRNTSEWMLWPKEK